MKKLIFLSALSAVIVGLVIGIAIGVASSECHTEGLRGTWVLKWYGEPGKLRLAYPFRQVTLIISQPCATEPQELKSPILLQDGISGYIGGYEYGGCYEVDGGKFVTGNIWQFTSGGHSCLVAQSNRYLDILRSAETYEIKNCRLVISSGEEFLLFKRKE